ncbi:MAG: hypothetical protein J6B50_02770 [Lachnospiraceae bacterium]|nr:hypothetical protein [Lachnospiraceae bacterium]MBP3504827.1 hypothetical protein [Lachnospiraceae bacterium]
MDSRNMDKALELYAKLTMGEEIRRSHPENGSLYEEYYQNAEVYEILNQILKKLNLNLYEYKEALYLSAGEGNRVFGYTNEELKRLMGLRYNRELYMAYYIMYRILLCFYQDSASYQYREYIRLEEIVKEVSASLSTITRDLSIYSMEEIEENSFKSIALLWEELPMVTGEDREQLRASRASRMGLAKLVCNFLLSQNLFVDVNERYYPTDRLKALAEQYFEEYRGRIYELLERGEEHAEY